MPALGNVREEGSFWLCFSRHSGESKEAGAAWLIVMEACSVASLGGSGKRERDLKWNWTVTLKSPSLPAYTC